MDSIMKSDGSERSASRIQLLPEQEFYSLYLPLCAPLQNPKREQSEEIYDQLTLLDSLLRPALQARWGQTDAYYEVTDDWNVCWHHAMSLCSDEMCCGEFLNIVEGILASMNHVWCFHVSLECDADIGWGPQRAGRGQIFFFSGKIFGNGSDAFDYTLFKR
jgi:hypothetical protein